MLKALMRDSVIYAIPAIVSRGLAVLLIPLYTRMLSPADYGSFDLFLTFAALINLTIALEVSQGIVRFYSTETNPEQKVLYASSGFWFSLFSFTLFLLIALTCSNSLSILIMGREGLQPAFQIGVVYVFLNGIFYLIQNQFRFELRSINFAIVNLLVAVITALLTIGLTYLLSWGLNGFLIAMVGGTLVGCLYGLWYLRKSFCFRFRWDSLKEMLIFSIPLVPSGIAVFVGLYIDRLMINHYLSLHDVGLYGVGFRVASIIGVVMVGFQGALTPLIYAHSRDPQTPAHLARIFRLFVALALLVFLAITLFVDEVLMVLTVPSYYAATSIVVFLVPAILLSNMYIFAPGTSIEKKTYLILWINVLGAFLNILLNFLLIPSFGINGAATAKLVSYGLVFFLYMWFSQKLYFVPHDWKLLTKATLLIVAIAYALPKIDVLFEMGLSLRIMGIIAAFFVILSTGLVQVVELQNFKIMIRKHFVARKN